MPHKYQMAADHHPEKNENRYNSATVWLILMICTSYDMFHCKSILFRDRTDAAPHIGVKSPNFPNAQNISSYYENYFSDSSQVLQNDKHL